MNLQQLEYIVSVDTHRHFEKAAEKCFVTQATLSAMIKKLEQELDVILFDRSKQPVVPTEVGRTIIEQARVILKETQQLKNLSKEAKSGSAGELRIGVIPTVAPYLLPLFLTDFFKKIPGCKVENRRTDNGAFAPTFVVRQAGRCHHGHAAHRKRLCRKAFVLRRV